MRLANNITKLSALYIITKLINVANTQTINNFLLPYKSDKFPIKGAVISCVSAFTVNNKPTVDEDALNSIA